MPFEIIRTQELTSRGLPKRQVDKLPRVPGLPGVRVVGEPPEDRRLIRIHGVWQRAPADAVVSGWAAAALHGVPATFLDGTRDGVKTIPVDLSVGSDIGNCDTSGIRIRRSRVPKAHRMRVDDVVVSTPERTALDLARWARHEARRLAMLDLSARHGLISRDEFTEFLDPLGGLHRLSNVRALLPLVSTRAESVPESEIRYHWNRVGLPSPLVNQPVHDRFGKFVGRPDLLDEESGLTVEYQGYVHLLDRAPELDRARFERFSSMNMTVVDIWKSDVERVGDLLLDGYRRATERDRRLDSWVCSHIER